MKKFELTSFSFGGHLPSRIQALSEATDSLLSESISFYTYLEVNFTLRKALVF